MSRFQQKFGYQSTITQVDVSDAADLTRVVRLLRGPAEVTRFQLSEALGLSRAQVNQRLDVLRRLGLLDDLPPSASTGGRPPRVLKLRQRQGHVLSIALGIRGSSVAAVDLNGEMIDETRDDLDVADGPHIVLQRCVEMVSELDDKINLGTALGVGISVPGPVDYARGVVSSPPVMPGWDQFPIRSWISERLGIPCWLDNDANAMALGEHRYGAGRGHADIVVVKIGSGIGSGIIMGGALQRGDKGCAGDIGHLPVRTSDIPCRCGNVGCLEAVAGGLALGTAAEALVDVDGGSAPVLKRIVGDRKPSAADLVRAAELGDTDCLVVLQEAGERIGRVLANVISLLNPSKVIVAGGLAMTGEILFATVRKSLYAHALPLASRDLLLQRTVLGPSAAIHGTAELVLDQLFSPVIFPGWKSRVETASA